MAKKSSGGFNNVLKWVLVLGGGFLAFEYVTNKGGQYDYISKVLDQVSSNYVRGGKEWGDRYYTRGF